MYDAIVSALSKVTGSAADDFSGKASIELMQPKYGFVVPYHIYVVARSLYFRRPYGSYFVPTPSTLRFVRRDLRLLSGWFFHARVKRSGLASANCCNHARTADKAHAEQGEGSGFWGRTALDGVISRA